MHGRGPEQPGPDDELHVDVSDLGAPTTPPTRSPLAPRRTPRQRVARLAVALATGLVVAVGLVSSIPAAREAGRGLLTALGPTPTPPLLPGSDLFYLLPNPPGVEVSLDGRALGNLPAPGGSHPLRLARGHHVFVWRSHTLPFQPLQCRVSVPRASGDTCPFVPVRFLPQALGVVAGAAIVAMHVSLAALVPQDATALTAAIQTALDASRSTAVVQPGERYYFYQPGQVGAPVVAQQPLRATLGDQLVSDSGYPEPCIAPEGVAVPCCFPGQDCGQLCTMAQPPPSAAGPPGTWIVAVAVSGTWDYATLGGQVVGQRLGDGGFPLQLAVLRITWDGAGWHVTPIFGHTPGLDVIDDAVCDPLREALEHTSVWSFMVVDPPPGAQVQFASDSSPIDGCAAVLSQAPGVALPSSLYRFGVLLTVNDAASDSLDNLPAANAAEQRLAQQLLAQLQP